MQESMSLKALLEEVIRQESPEPVNYPDMRVIARAKRDFTTSTQANIRMIHNTAYKADTDPVSIVLLRDGATELERFDLTENAHRQISARLAIPWKYYQRCLADHADLVVAQVNALFEREPENRMLRVLDGKVRAFLSDRYLALDNNEVLRDILPTITEGERNGSLRVMSNNIGDDKMHMKVIFLGDELSHEVARVRGEPRIIRPGFRLSNSETGQGSLKMEGFFYDDYCTNGCVFGVQNAFTFSRRHVGSRLIEGEGFEVISNETRKLEDKAIISAVNDGMKAISSPETVAKLADSLRRAHNSEKVGNAAAAVDLAVKELDLNNSDTNAILETFIRDQDYSQFGLASAITELANNEDTNYQRVCDIEDIGAQVLSLGASQWRKYVEAVPMAA